MYENVKNNQLVSKWRLFKLWFFITDKVESTDLEEFKRLIRIRKFKLQINLKYQCIPNNHLEW